MTLTETIRTRKRVAPPRVFHRLAAALGDWNNRRITRNELSRLSDHELKDIGVNRGDIEAIIHHW